VAALTGLLPQQSRTPRNGASSSLPSGIVGQAADGHGPPADEIAGDRAAAQGPPYEERGLLKLDVLVDAAE
jgi:hypothetical protein